MRNWETCRSPICADRRVWRRQPAADGAVQTIPERTCAASGGYNDPGIALDDPAQIPEDRQRYDVGMILTGREDPCGLPVRTVAGGRWQYLKSPIPEEGVSDFWRDLPQRAARLPVDGTRPILERYAHPKVSAHICEFCVPLRESKLRGI